jgi:hypothetical protein
LRKFPAFFWSSKYARIPGQVQQLKDLAAKAKEFGAAAISGSINVHRDSSIDPAGAGGHDEDAIAHLNCFIDVMGDQQHRSSPELGKSRPAMRRRRVDFPQALGPTMEMNSPGATEKETASRANMRVVARSLALKIFVTLFTLKEEPLDDYRIIPVQEKF